MAGVYESQIALLSKYPLRHPMYNGVITDDVVLKVNVEIRYTKRTPGVRDISDHIDQAAVSACTFNTECSS
jgi:hypothetical protein